MTEPENEGYAIRRTSDGAFYGKPPRMSGGFRRLPSHSFLKSRSRAELFARVDLGMGLDDFEILTRAEVRALLSSLGEPKVG